ncbi:NnrS family protein [Oryzibacter oryziterrae]|uniref:NnrS family protein n=1 Tax=Oryzibacter oryziterrae TaxID=2766474 RepID=UPI001F3467D4|nr:NnrS family protein [Oryzibacter oryziterrae]
MFAPTESYRLAFVLAALTALRAIGPGFGDITTHAQELIFGFLGIQLFGFMLVALPRWIGRPLAKPLIIQSLLLLHALAFGLGFLSLPAAAMARSAIVLCAILIFSVSAFRARSWKSLPVLMLAGLHASAGVTAAWCDWPPATMVGLAAILAICLEISNRIGVAVIEVARTRSGRPANPPPPRWLGQIQRLSSLAALALWAVDRPSAILCFLAAASGFIWLWRLRAWETPPFGGVLLMILGMFWKRLGFLLLGLQTSLLPDLPPSVPIHAFTIGGLASLAMAIASSIVRKKNGEAFKANRLADLGFLAMALVPFTRIDAALQPEAMESLLDITRWIWLLAFTAYAAFLLRRPKGIRSLT